MHSSVRGRPSILSTTTKKCKMVKIFSKPTYQDRTMIRRWTVAGTATLVRHFTIRHFGRDLKVIQTKQTNVQHSELDRTTEDSRLARGRNFPKREKPRSRSGSFGSSVHTTMGLQPTALLADGSGNIGLGPMGIVLHLWRIIILQMKQELYYSYEVWPFLNL